MVRNFPSTNHTFIDRVAQRDPEALQQFVEDYGDPLRAYIRSDLRLTAAEAEDCISAFFAEFARPGKSFIYNPVKGRFRSFLLGALNHRISTFVRRANAQKRGGGMEHLSLDEARHIPDIAVENFFVREWAQHVLSRAKARMFAKFGNKEFSILYPFLTEPSPDYEKLGAQLGITSDAVRKRLKVLLPEFRECLRAEVRETLVSPTELEISTEMSLLRQYFFL